jgi:hypothetical protein
MNPAVDGYERLDCKILHLPAEHRPYARSRPPRLREPNPTDAEGVVVFRHEGSTSYHPVQIAQHALGDLEGYRLTEKRIFLQRARASLRRLEAESVSVRDAIYFPYRFDFALAGNPDDIMDAPWYSAMAQGQVLSLATRLLEIEHDDVTLRVAEGAFASFFHGPTPINPWTVFVDAPSLWFEEYAKDPPMRVLNGHIFAIFGLYDYCRFSADPRAEDLLRGGAATVRRHGEDFRDPGALSRYCLRVPTLKNAKYHVIHQNQLRLLAQMTGDAWFSGLADRMAADQGVHPPTLFRRILRRAGRALSSQSGNRRR